MWVENYTHLSDLEKEGVVQTREGVLTKVMINREVVNLTNIKGNMTWDLYKIDKVGLMVQKQCVPLADTCWMCGEVKL